MGNSLEIEGVEIKGCLGEGSFGVVHKAKWNGRFVAVKRLKDEVLWYETDALERFQKECDLLRVLKHPNIVQMYEVLFLEGRSPILITELLFCDLQQYINTSKTTPKVLPNEAIRIMLDVAKGLKFLLDRVDPIVHRDLKSKNILLDSKCRAKIADLGQARQFPRLAWAGSARATPVPGTTVYMAPETFLSAQANRYLAEYGTPIDIFSFGVVLLEVIVGHPPLPKPLLMPYGRDGTLVPEHSRRQRDLKDMGSLHPLREIVLQCLENDPQRRPTINQILRDLERSDGGKRVTLKLSILGSSGVGKSLLLKRYVDPDFPYLAVKPTYGADQNFVPLQIQNQLIVLRIVDPAGQERFDSIAPALFRGSHGAFLVYDVNEPRSFAALPKWKEFVDKFCGENVKLMLVGNKSDLVRTVGFKQAQDYADSYQMEHLEVSAKTLEKVDEMFELMARKILDSLDLNDVHTLERTMSGIHLTDESGDTQQRCSC